MDTGGAVLHSVQRLLSRLSRSSDQSEMALFGMVPLGDRQRPLLVFRTSLRADRAGQIRTWLGAGDVASKSRMLHDHQVYQFRAGVEGTEDLGKVEVAVVGTDMVVSNDERMMARVLDPRTVAGQGFGSSERFTRLRRAVVAPPGSLMVYADWQALRPVLEQVFRAEVARLLAFSGIGAPQQLMFVARPAPRKGGQKRGLITSVALHHEHREPAGRSTTPRPGNREPGRWRPDGWFDLVRPAHSRALAPGLSGGAVASFATMFDVDRILPTHRSLRMRWLQAAIFRAGRRTGINLQREVVRRLSGVGGVHLVTLADDAGGLHSAWSMRAKSISDAKDLFRVFERMFVPQGSARLESTSDGGSELRFAARYAGVPTFVTRAQDTLVVAFRPEVTAELRKAIGAGRRSTDQQRRLAVVQQQLRRLGVSRQQQLTGVFGLDLGFLAQVAEPEHRASDRRSGLLGMHTGFFQIDRDLVRLEVFTELDHP